jgi:hypothetical protein
MDLGAGAGGADSQQNGAGCGEKVLRHAAFSLNC